MQNKVHAATGSSPLRWLIALLGVVGMGVLLMFTDAVPASAQGDQENSPATGAPIILGTAKVGITLYAHVSAIEDADGLDNATFQYQWIRNDGTQDQDISGATARDYTLVSDDEDQTIKVRVSFNDDAGNPEELTSEPTEAVRPNNPATGTPTISGTMRVGEYLTVDTSSITDADGMSRDDFYISFNINASDYFRVTGFVNRETLGGLNPDYRAAPWDAGLTIRVTLSFDDDLGNRERFRITATESVAPTNPSPPHNLEISSTAEGTLNISWEAPEWDLGEFQDGSDNVGDGGSPITGYTVQWKEAADSWDSAADVSEATVTGTTHTVPGLTGGVEYTLRVFASNEIGDSAFSDEATGTPEGTAPSQQPPPTSTPPQQPPPTSSASTSSQQQAPPANSPATGAPAIAAQVGDMLTADTSLIEDADGLTGVSFSYQWLISDGISDTEIEGATDAMHTSSEEDAGKHIKVRVSFTDDGSNEETLTSGATPLVARIDSPSSQQEAPAETASSATGLPIIDGRSQVGEALTVDLSLIQDPDGLTEASFSYQWLTSDGTTDSEIEGATEPTYTPSEDDVGKRIKVRVSFTDDGDNEETLTSVATAIVAQDGSPAAPGGITAINGPNPGEVIVTWEAEAGASFYRIGWLSKTDYQNAGDDWLERFAYADVEDKTTHTLTRLTPGEDYWFLVGSNTARYGAPTWLDTWVPLTLNADELACPTTTK